MNVLWFAYGNICSVNDTDTRLIWALNSTNLVIRSVWSITHIEPLKHSNWNYLYINGEMTFHDFESFSKDKITFTKVWSSKNFPLSINSIFELFNSGLQHINFFTSFTVSFWDMFKVLEALFGNFTFTEKELMSCVVDILAGKWTNN